MSNGLVIPEVMVMNTVELANGMEDCQNCGKEVRNLLCATILIFCTCLRIKMEKKCCARNSDILYPASSRTAHLVCPGCW